MSLNGNADKVLPIVAKISYPLNGHSIDGSVDLSGYATEQYVKDYAQPKGNYLTEHQSLDGYAKTEDIPTKVSQLENDKGYLTEHQDISGKLDASALPTAINTALAQAKASGEFDGKDGDPGKDGYTPVKGKDYFDGSPGKDYVLTDADKAEIAGQAAELVDVPDSCGFVAQDTAPEDTSVLWIDTGDDSADVLPGESTDPGSGNSGGDNWEVIVDYTVPEGETAGPIDFTVDKDGNAFDLKKAIIFLTVIPPEGFTSVRAIKACFDKDYTKTGHWGFSAEVGATIAAGTNIKGSMYFNYVENCGKSYIGWGTKPQNTNTMWTSMTTFRNVFTLDSTTGLVIKNTAGEEAVINAFKIGSLETNFLGAGSMLKVLGVRK